MGSRRRSREMVLQALYAMDLTGLWDQDPVEFLFDREQWPSCLPFASKILKGVLNNRQSLDQAIEANASHWTMSRMNLIERNVLRIAAFELLFCEDIPVKVSINEALEVAKRYGTSETRRFLNGVLDKIGKGSE